MTEYLIAGERVALGVLRRDLAATSATWMNRCRHPPRPARGFGILLGERRGQGLEA